MTRKSIEKTVEELALQIPFKGHVEQGDVVLLAEDDGKECRVLYAQALTVINKTISGETWHQLELAFLTVPLSYGSLAVRRAQMRGLEIVKQADGRKLFVKAVNTKDLLDIHPTLGSCPPDPDSPRRPRPVVTYLRLVKSDSKSGS